MIKISYIKYSDYRRGYATRMLFSRIQFELKSIYFWPPTNMISKRSILSAFPYPSVQNNVSKIEDAKYKYMIYDQR
jgi:hypothetical protein